MKETQNYKILPYISEDKINARVAELGKIITNDYKGKKLKCVGILKGSITFMSDLIKHIDNDKLTIDFMALSSYGSGTKSSGVVKILKDLDAPIEGEDILIIEDIIDSGITMSYIIELLNTRNPKSIKVCTLLDKPERRVVNVNTDYVGFEIEDKYIVGCGLDYDQHYRQLPYIGEVVFN